MKAVSFSPAVSVLVTRSRGRSVTIVACWMNRPTPAATDRRGHWAKVSNRLAVVAQTRTTTQGRMISGVRSARSKGTRPSDVTVSRSSPWSPLSKSGTQIISTQQANATHGSRCARRCVRFPRGHGVILEFAQERVLLSSAWRRRGGRRFPPPTGTGSRRPTESRRPRVRR